MAWWKKSRNIWVARIKITENGKEFRREFQGKTAEIADKRKNEFMNTEEFQAILKDIKGHHFNLVKREVTTANDISTSVTRLAILMEICRRKKWDFNMLVNYYNKHKEDFNGKDNSRIQKDKPID